VVYYVRLKSLSTGTGGQAQGVDRSFGVICKGCRSESALVDLALRPGDVKRMVLGFPGNEVTQKEAVVAGSLGGF